MSEHATVLEKLHQAQAAGLSYAVDFETTGLDITARKRTKPHAPEHRPVGVAVAFQDGSSYYLSWSPEAHACLEQAVGVRGAKVWAHNWKFELQVCRNLGVTVRCTLLDSMLCAWMVGIRDVGLKPLALNLLGLKLRSFEEVLAGRPIAAVCAGELADYAKADAAACLRIGLMLWTGPMARHELHTAYLDLEAPFIDVLRSMEQVGMAIDRDQLSALHARCESRAAALAARFQDLTTTRVLVPVKRRVQAKCEECEGRQCPACNQTGLRWYKNGNPYMRVVTEMDYRELGADITKDQQVARWLYEELGWWPTLGVPKGAAGHYTTSKDYVQQFEGMRGPAGEAAALRLQHQEARKLATTYTLPLIELADQYPDGRLHTSFHQAGTATQRLSSSFPNLQNLPGRSESGKLVRRCIVAAPGNVLLVRDYSQIELRLMAHFSQDVKLLEAYREGLDIHAMTMEALGCERVPAKTYNFSIIYRIQPKKLRLKLGNSVSLQEAADAIEAFYTTYPGIRRYHNKAVAFWRSNGYAPTLTGYKRFIPRPDNPREMWAAENRAINTPIQGSVGGLIKRAMVGIHRRLRGRRSAIVGQVHDEIIVEAPLEEADEVEELMRREMEGVMRLSVPLLTEGGRGANLLEAK